MKKPRLRKARHTAGKGSNASTGSQCWDSNLDGSHSKAVILTPLLAIKPGTGKGQLTLAELTVVEVPWLPVDEPVSLQETMEQVSPATGPRGCRAFIDSISRLSTRWSKRSRSWGEMVPLTSERSRNWRQGKAGHSAGSSTSRWDGPLPPQMTCMQTWPLASPPSPSWVPTVLGEKSKHLRLEAGPSII